MSPERWQQLKPIFFAALDHPPADRASFLEGVCGGDTGLRAELDGLLAAEEEVPPILDASPEGLAGLAKTDAPPAPGLVGQILGPYRIVREIGHGGMGSVYLAEREDVGRRVALKLVRRSRTTPEALQRFLAERRILARLDHPNIARLLDAGRTADGLPYFAMENVAGQPLTTYCDRRRLSVSERLGLFAEVCEAVRYAHQNLVIHRDLKPSNILVTEDADGGPQVKLLDFGIAKLIEDDAAAGGLTRTGLRAMTPAYAAPELVRGGAVTTATDVYSLGVLLYELLAGGRPYRLEGCTPGEVERVICRTPPVKPSIAVGRVQEELQVDGAVVARTPPAVSAARSTEPARLRRRLQGDLDVISMKALAKEPAQRYSSAEALLEDLKRHRAGLPVKARPSTVGYRLRSFIKRHRSGVATALATAALMATLIGFYTVRLTAERDRVEQERDRVEQELAKSEAVTAFLMGLFEAGDPRESRGETLNVYDLLERGTARAEELSAEPLVKARLLDVIGTVYHGLGEYEPAQSLLERALELRRRLLAPAHPDVAESLDHLAGLLTDRGDYGSAEPLAREALAARRAVPGKARPDLAHSLDGLASLLLAKGEFDEAEEHYREALELRRRLLGESHFDTVSSMNNLGLLLEQRGDLDEAETLYRRVVAIDRATLGQAHPDMAVDIHNLAGLLMDLGEYREAEPLFLEALGMRRKTLGDGHPDVAASRLGLAVLLARQARYDEAEEQMAQALAIQQAARGEDHPHTMTAMVFLGQVRHRQGEPEVAEPLLRKGLEGLRRSLGDGHPATARALQILADLLASRGDVEAAEGSYGEALEVQRRVLTEGHRDIVRSLRGLAALEAARGDLGEAERLYRRVLALQRQRLRGSHPELAITLLGLAGVLALGEPAAAEGLLQEALSIYRQRLGEGHLWTREVRESLERLRRARGEPAPRSPGRSASP